MRFFWNRPSAGPPSAPDHPWPGRKGKWPILRGKILGTSRSSPAQTKPATVRWAGFSHDPNRKPGKHFLKNGFPSPAAPPKKTVKTHHVRSRKTPNPLEITYLNRPNTPAPPLFSFPFLEMAFKPLPPRPTQQARPPAGVPPPWGPRPPGKNLACCCHWPRGHVWPLHKGQSVD